MQGLYKAALVGCGRMGAHTSPSVLRWAPEAWLPLNHLDAILETPGLELVAVCDTDPELLERTRRRARGAAGFSNHQELLSATRPDVLAIATRTPYRHTIIRDALATGVSGLHLEKPLCNTLQQLVELESLLSPARIVCTFGTLRRYMPLYGQALQFILEERLGPLRQVQVNMGRGSLFWTHPHSVDLLLFFAGDGEVESVSARFETQDLVVDGATFDADPIVRSLCLEFSNGVSGVVGQTGGCDVVLACDRGVITIESDGRRLRVREPDGEDVYWDKYCELRPVPGPGGTRLALARIVAGLDGHPDTVAADKQAILRGQRVLFACAQSHLDGGKSVDPNRLHPDISVTGRTGSRFA